MENHQIQQFTNQLFGNVRVLNINGEPWFIGNEIAGLLGYQNSRDAIGRHVLDIDRSTVAIHDGSQNRNMTIINESGLYSLIFGSRLPAAREFTHWVTFEVLPTMRKIGFTRSMQYLQEENQRLKGLVEGYEESNFMANIDRIAEVERTNQIIEKIDATKDYTPLSPELKVFFKQHNPNWNTD